ncbi:hypothetical protein [Oleiagrimonas sp.]|jgi:uncharacterized membrane protein|uniref:hypothetical protein n=1 Tax=Oleiagrimonas sp. TaxID=2010330 RepID=UPI00261BBECD|nr:hypothetical protein [Oleiagrimonas sp.]MDA3914874.1 hypothetical protein [Oleiagrimonas sp.]
MIASTVGQLALGKHDASAARRVSWRAYAAMAAGIFLYVFAIWYEVYQDTRDDAAQWSDPFLQSHRQWRLRTTFVYLLWSILAGFSIPFGFGVLLLLPVWAWYAYRVAKGMILYASGRVI